MTPEQEREIRLAASLTDPRNGVFHALSVLLAAYDAQAARIAALEVGLREALEGWDDAQQYKGDYLAAKHGDCEDIARLRALLPPEAKGER